MEDLRGYAGTYYEADISNTQSTGLLCFPEAHEDAQVSLRSMQVDSSVDHDSDLVSAQWNCKRSNLNSQQRSESISTTSSATRLQDILKKLRHLDVTGCVEIDEQDAISGGGYCDIFIGYVNRKPGRVKVAIRQLRVYITSDHDFKKVCFDWLNIWILT